MGSQDRPMIHQPARLQPRCDSKKQVQSAHQQPREYVRSTKLRDNPLRPGLRCGRHSPDQRLQLRGSEAVEEEMRRDQIVCISGKLHASARRHSGSPPAPRPPSAGPVRACGRSNRHSPREPWCSAAATRVKTGRLHRPAPMPAANSRALAETSAAAVRARAPCRVSRSTNSGERSDRSSSEQSRHRQEQDRRQ